MAELVDALDSGSSQGNLVDVRVILAAILFLLFASFNCSAETMELTYPKVALVANGVIRDYPAVLKEIAKYDRIIAVDGGVNHCLAMELRPDLIVGDLDSANCQALAAFKDVPVRSYPTEKDETDLELAIEAAKEWGAQELGLFGCTEGRTDHLLYNLHILYRLPAIRIESQNETIFLLENSQTVTTCPGQTVSLIPIAGPCEGITTKGLRWELNNHTFDSHFMSLSNIALGNSFEIAIAKGRLLCILQKL